MRRGEIWRVYSPTPFGSRPELLLMPNKACPMRSQVIFSPITSHVRELPTEFAMGSEDGLMMPSAVNLDVIMTANKDLHLRRIGAVSPFKMHQVYAVPRLALGLEY